MLNGLKFISREERVKDYILPLKIKDYSGNIKGIDNLLKQKDLQIVLEEDDITFISGKAYIVLDFGKEIHGGVRLLTHSINKKARIRLRFGESLSETYSEIKCEGTDNTATNEHSLRDFEIELCQLSDMQFGQTGFRFLRIDFLTDTDVRLKNVIGVFEHRDLFRKGSFECDDEIINKIFDVSAYTVELCMQNMLWDGIKRDRLVWIGDTHPEMMSIVSLFGEDECIEKALELCAKKAPVPKWINKMPAYSLWWLAILSDYYIHNENTEFVKSQKNYIISLVNEIDKLVDKNGFLDFESYFLDWPTFYFEERKAGVYALCSYAIKKSEALLNALDIDTTICKNILERINKNLDGGTFKQVNALKVLAEHIKADKVIDKQLSGGAEGLSTFMSYYILASIAEADKTSQAVEIMKEYYGGMLSKGATTFWEDFDINWMKDTNDITQLPKESQKDIHKDFGNFCYKGYRHSLCHGWASGPVPFLMHYVLGIRVIEKGCKKIQIKPNLAGLKFIKGKFPTPYGIIEINAFKQGEEVKTQIKAPKEIEIIR